jgi:hypothetical protein
MFAADTSALPQRIAQLVIAIDPARTSPDGSAVARLNSLHESVSTPARACQAVDDGTPPDENTAVRIAAAVVVELQTWQVRLRGG